MMIINNKFHLQLLLITVKVFLWKVNVCKRKLGGDFNPLRRLFVLSG